MFIIQNVVSPSAIRHSIADAIEKDLTEIRVSSAYLTCGGVEILLDCIRRTLNDSQFQSLRKVMVTSFDFGLTEPDAIVMWQQLSNAEVRVAGAQMVRKGSLTPAAAYHPKIYLLLASSGKGTAIVGSANLTSRGFTINTESALVQQNIAATEWEKAWVAVIQGTEKITEELLTKYRALRDKMPQARAQFEEVQPVPKPKVSSSLLYVFPEEVSRGRLDPADYTQMWVQVAKLQGGSRNQLELPRGAHRFFGFNFDNYGTTYVEHIGEPVLRAGKHTWRDRPLTWHGDNGMERINLPTLSQGGFEYSDSAIFFRNIGSGEFEVIVAPWESDMVKAWLQASLALQKVFLLGKRTERLVGFLS